MSTILQVSTQPVPQSFCPSNIATDWPFLAGLLRVTFPTSNSLFVKSQATPAPSDQSKPWIKLDANGNPERIYVFNNGSWIWPHGAAPGTISLYGGSEASITTFDGGEAGAVTTVSGPMWEKMTDMNGRVAVGPGTLATSGTVVAVGGTGGNDQLSVSIEKENLPAQGVDVGIGPGAPSSLTGPDLPGLFTTQDFQYDAGRNTTKIGRTRNMGDGTSLTINNMPAYYGLFFIRRTARIYYRA